MDQSQFDALTKGLASDASRRRVLGGLVGSAAALGLGGLTALEADARKKGNRGGKCTGKKKRCGGKCVNVNKSVKHCGACNASCGKGGTCAGGVCTLAVVRPGQTGAWKVRDNTPSGKTNGDVEFVVGPGAAPDGKGSVQFSTKPVTDKATLENDSYAGTKIANLSHLSYSTYMTQSGDLPHIAPAIKLEVTSNRLAGGSGTLIYEPVYDNSPEVAEGKWQDWDAFGSNARWWSSKDAQDESGDYVLCNPNGSNTGQCASLYISWDDVKAALPDAAITALLLEVGSYNANHIGSVDNLKVNDTIYDFEPES